RGKIKLPRLVPIAAAKFDYAINIVLLYELNQHVCLVGGILLIRAGTGITAFTITVFPISC
ncbi:MAG TPA: hypothetical protein VFU62_13080, partial [Hanamia sp.]|nr:hypothetical protein [Hanamia sp.]